MDKKMNIYTTPTCQYCRMAKEFFQSHDIEYTEFNVAEDAEKRDEMVQKSGQMGVPVIDVNGEIVIGFDQAKLSQLLGIN